MALCSYGPKSYSYGALADAVVREVDRQQRRVVRDRLADCHDAARAEAVVPELERLQRARVPPQRIGQGI